MTMIDKEEFAFPVHSQSPLNGKGEDWNTRDKNLFSIYNQTINRQKSIYLVFTWPLQDLELQMYTYSKSWLSITLLC